MKREGGGGIFVSFMNGVIFNSLIDCIIATEQARNWAFLDDAPTSGQNNSQTDARGQRELVAFVR